MNIKVFKSVEEASSQAAEHFLALQRSFDYGCTALPTGQSPIPFYTYLANSTKKAWLQPYKKNYFNLDEYVGLPIDEPKSFNMFLRQHFVFPCGIDPHHHHTLHGCGEDLEAECRTYEQKIDSLGGLTVTVLGLGSNGHIAFNEPGSKKTSRTRLVNLAESTLQANAKFFAPKPVPEKALTLGIENILSSEHIVLLAFGKHKKEALMQMIEAPESPDCPASFLKHHPQLTVFADSDAMLEASHLQSKA